MAAVIRSGASKWVALALALVGSVLSGCTRTFPPAQSRAEVLSGFTYVPIDPFPVYVSAAGGEAQPLSASMTPSEILRLLPDNAVRMSIEQIDQSGNVAYGPVGIGVRGGQYRVTIDYINADTTSIRVWIKPVSTPKKPPQPRGRPDVARLIPAVFHQEESGSEIVLYDYAYPGDYAVVDPFDLGSWASSEGGAGLVVTTERPDAASIWQYAEYNIPIYIGIGLRITADIEVVAGSVDISGLGLLGAHAEANKLSGSLVLQTLGVNGRAIAAALPIQSELNRTTTQNAVVAVGSIKALLYDNETVVSPRVVGLYLPFAADRPLLNAIISEISKEPPVWRPGRSLSGVLR